MVKQNFSNNEEQLIKKILIYITYLKNTILVNPIIKNRIKYSI